MGEGSKNRKTLYGSSVFIRCICCFGDLGCWLPVSLPQVLGEPLIQRKDDTAEVLKSRLEAFHIQTEPAVDHYSKHGLVANLHAEN
ncbi:hypothetical protein BRADI_2g11286v3 [Brachypodium distachyon]|uniref:adenylate kinase n=1 Tax=Brachypodium distachyon TaxID=15368 RepID=A0A0Q3JZV8_BRADI|nr:hypothetical protein BRADI_2g11286v3 [Brachypodium distachyon]